MTGELVTERHGAVLIARLNRPDARNALNAALIDAIGRAVTGAENDPRIRAIVLTAAGDRIFCSGMDLREFASGGGASGSSEGMAGFDRLLRGELTVPVVGAANGTAVGGGLELLLGCDVIVAAETARFGLPEVKRGLYPAGGGTAIGTRIPLAVALEMTMTGEPIEAARAYEVGLINAVVPPEQVLDAALGLAESIAGNAPLGLAAVKELVRLGVTDPARAAQGNKELQRSVFSSEDAREGAAAFMEKRKPVWKGR
ncbi:crotonase/enoyl-CoA hydratase family protein [Actinomadura nitritigenes]|uniref:Enoyl-CoA hydratase/isomerase family protein n=1 Tax=Actinomadura nitritigenes TaxID=134602 RepID=A0ABS3QZP0_9ACTN|nr:enoyl-CoA hydratase-related protein [Actinomadura nitritigenes]MBO2439411.1 enoyl-CoA hydratase/isomerase family protein [Actinomadura nitritigenes]